MIEYIRMVIATFIMFVSVWIGADILFEEKSKKEFLGILMIIIGSLIVSIFNMKLLVSYIGYAKVLVVFLMMIFFFNKNYRVKTSDSLIGSAIIYANLAISELIAALIISVIERLFSVDILTSLRYGIILDLITVIISLSILKILNKKYLQLFGKIKNNDTKLVTAIMAVFVIVIIISGIIPLNDIKLGIEMILITMVIVGFIIVGAYIFLESIEKDNMLKEYEQLSDYAKANENLLEDYRVRCHESNNHLIIIDHMIPKSNKKAHEYINSLLNDHKMNKYYFINELKNIPITELKGFINFKLMIMINENMNLQINVSPEITNSKLRRLSQKDKTDLYNIVGVLLDNAYDASKESKEKEVVFTMYKEGTTIVLMVANTHKGKIDIDRISEYGYSTKGKNHGTGLYIVDKIINKNPRFTKETSTMENYFIQTIRIK